MAVTRANAMAIGIVGLLQGAPAAYAQSVADFEKVDEGVHVGGHVRIAYDDNLLRFDDDVVVPTDRSKEDVIASVAATLRARLAPGMQEITVTGEYGRQYYEKNSFLNRERITADVRWDWRLGTRCAGEAQIGYSKGQGDLADQTLLVANAREVFNTFAAGGCRVGLGWKPTLYIRRTEINNSNVTQAAADSRQFAYGAGIAYRRTRTAGVEIDYRKNEIVYPNRIDPATGSRSKVTMDSVSVRLDLRLANRISVGFSAGHYWIAGEEARDFRAFVGGVNVALDISPMFRLDALARRNIQVPTYVPASVVVNDRVEVGASYRISPKTRIGVRGGRERNDYRAARPALAGSTRTFDERSYVIVDAKYRLRPSWELNLEFQYTDQKADSLFGNYEGSRFFIETILAI